MPEQITDAVRDHDHIHSVATPCNVRDVLYFANLLAEDDMSWLPAIRFLQPKPKPARPIAHVMQTCCRKHRTIFRAYIRP
jgi:hypothetical protein